MTDPLFTVHIFANDHVQYSIYQTTFCSERCACTNNVDPNHNDLATSWRSQFE